METLVGIRRANAKAVRRLVHFLCIALLGIGVVFASRGPPPPPLEALDPAFMKAVTASVSQKDVEAILAHQRSSAPVHLQLYTSCDDAQRCTIFTTMDFSHSDSHAPTVSLRVAVQVLAGTGSAHGSTASSWQVQASDPTIHQQASYAGDFTDLKDVPPIGENHAIANLLTAIESAIGKVLDSNGMINHVKT